MSEHQDNPNKRLTRATSTENSQFFRLDQSSQPIPLTPLNEPNPSTFRKQTENASEEESVEEEEEIELPNVIGPRTNLSKIKNTRKRLNEQIEQNKKLEKFLNENRNIVEVLQSENQILKNTIEDREKQVIQKELQKQALINTIKKMSEIAVGDLINGIPSFDGNLKNLESFINTCDVFDSIANQASKTLVFNIAKAKITGEAFNKLSPLNTLNDWNALKTRLRERLRKPMTFEFAQEDINAIFQKKDESLADYGNRVKEKLTKLNQASTGLTQNNDALTVVRTANEKQAISKFQQNIRDENIKILVSAAAKTSLEDCISFALQTELMRRNTNIKKCSICGKDNHDQSTCRQKTNQQQNRRYGPQNKYKNSYGYNNNNLANRFSRLNIRENNNTNSISNNNSNPSTSNNSGSNDRPYGNFQNRNNTNDSNNDNKNNYSRKNYSQNRSNNGNGNGNSPPRTIKSVDTTETPDITVKEGMITVEQILNFKLKEEETKN